MNYAAAILAVVLVGASIRLFYVERQIRTYKADWIGATLIDNETGGRLTIDGIDLANGRIEVKRIPVVLANPGTWRVSNEMVNHDGEPVYMLGRVNAQQNGYDAMVTGEVRLSE